MNTFKVKILQLRKRLGIKEIQAPSIAEAEEYLLNVLCQYLNVSPDKIEKSYVLKEGEGRKLKVIFPSENERIRLSIDIKSKYVFTF